MATDTTDKTVLEAPRPAAWRIGPWLDRVPISRTTFYEERKKGRIEIRKCGDATLVVTQPDDYVASLPAA